MCLITAMGQRGKGSSKAVYTEVTGPGQSMVSYTEVTGPGQSMVSWSRSALTDWLQRLLI